MEKQALLQICFGWPYAVSSGEGTGKFIYLFFLHQHLLKTLLEFEPATLSVTSLAFLPSDLLPGLILDRPLPLLLPLDSALIIQIVKYDIVKLTGLKTKKKKPLVSAVFRSKVDVGYSLSSGSFLFVYRLSSTLQSVLQPVLLICFL